MRVRWQWFDVILLEAGGFNDDDPARSDIYDGSVVAPHPPSMDFRRIRFGGTTNIWGGRCVPLDPIDFERRDYIANSGWPISHQDVARHYPRAMECLDLDLWHENISHCLRTNAGEALECHVYRERPASGRATVSHCNGNSMKRESRSYASHLGIAI